MLGVVLPLRGLKKSVAGPDDGEEGQGGWFRAEIGGFRRRYRG